MKVGIITITDGANYGNRLQNLCVTGKHKNQWGIVFAH